MSSVEFELAQVDTQWILNKIFSGQSRRNSYKPVVLGADRPGTLVWEAAKNGEIMRYVTLERFS